MELGIWANTVQAGVFYGLIGLAYLLFVRATGVLNFALGAYVMFSGLTAAYLAVDLRLPMPVGVVGAIVSTIVLAWMTEALIIRPMHARVIGEYGPIMAVIAFMFVVDQAAGLIYGRRPFKGPPLVPGEFQIGDSYFTGHDIVVLLGTLVIFLAVSWWLKSGRFGRMLRAVGDDAEAARSIGLPVKRVQFFAVALAGSICGIAGVFVVHQVALTFSSGLHFAIMGFLAFVMGGADRAWAPAVGGMLIAITETVTSRFIGGSYQHYMMLGLVLLVFTFRPSGLFTVRLRT